MVATKVNAMFLFYEENKKMMNYINNYRRFNNFVKTDKVSGDATQLVLTIPERVLCNRTNLCICIAQEIPAEVGKDSVVKLQVGSEEYAVVNPCLNFIYGDQLRSGRAYCFKFAIDTLGFVYRGGWRLCPTQHAFSCIPLTPAKKVAPKINQKPKDKDKEQ